MRRRVWVLLGATLVVIALVLWQWRWIQDNYTWVFSGAGVSVLLGFVTLMGRGGRKPRSTAKGEGERPFKQRHQEPEDASPLRLTGARPGWRGRPAPWYRVELVNLSPHPVWIDGVYADWRDAGDGRIAFKGKETYTNHRTTLASGGLVTLVNAFTLDDFAETALEGREAEIVADYAYLPKGTDKHQCAWRIRGGAHGVAAEELEDIPAWFFQRQEALGGPIADEQRTGLEGAWADGPSASSSAVQASFGEVAQGDEDER